MMGTEKSKKKSQINNNTNSLIWDFEGPGGKKHYNEGGKRK